jgi:hypothetical protein
MKMSDMDARGALTGLNIVCLSTSFWDEIKDKAFKNICVDFWIACQK